LRHTKVCRKGLPSLTVLETVKLQQNFLNRRISYSISAKALKVPQNKIVSLGTN